MKTIRYLIGGLALLAPLPAAAQDHDHAHDAQTVGTVSFPTSCSAGAQAHFEDGVAKLHSFWFPAAREAFEAAAREDATCAMAHWGLAVNLLGNPMARSAPSPENVTAGLAHARQAVELAARASHREQMYAAAALALYENAETLDHFARMARFEEAMGRLAAAHPEDDEAAIFHALAMVANAPPTDLTFAKQLAGAAILEPIFIRKPEHPGLAHYIIHAYDAPPIAQRGLDAAERYAGIAPSAPHALHMPSHIFTRLGYWEQSAETNERSAEAEPNLRGRLHPWDYMVYAYLQLGRYDTARAVVEEALRVEREAVAANPEGYTRGVVNYNLVAMPARYALERDAWSEAAGLELLPGMTANVEAVTRFARGLGHARLGHARPAAAEAARMEELLATLRTGNDRYWEIATEAQLLALRAWIAHAEGRHAEALDLGRRAADLEETVEKHPVTPGPLLPARELYAELLTLHDQPEEALTAAEATLVREPNRARTLRVAAEAADAAGDVEAAERYARLLRELQSGADDPSLTET